MVNYDDPVVVERVYCAYAFTTKHTNLGSKLTSFDSGDWEALACYGRSLLVRLPHHAGPLLS